MAVCKGCFNRLGQAVGTSGHCNPCYLATRIERVVLTRYPPAKAAELTHYLAKVLNNLEADTEAFETDKTSGVVDQQGYLIEKKDTKVRPPLQLAAGEHPGDQHPQAASAGVKKEKQAEAEVGTPGSSSRHRRRRREEKGKSRSRSRRRDRRKTKKEATPEPEQEVATEPEEEQEEAAIEAEVETEENEEVSEEPSQQDDDVSPDTEVARDPEGAGLRKVPPKPSARKPLPRRPRTPSRSPPGYRGRQQEPTKKWKGVKHIIRGQTLGYSSKGRPCKGKGKGKWHRR